MPRLIEFYRRLKQHHISRNRKMAPSSGIDGVGGDGSCFEFIFVSGGTVEELFDTYFAEMPWLAMPFSNSSLDARREPGQGRDEAEKNRMALYMRFKVHVHRLPMLATFAIDPSTREVTLLNRNALHLIDAHSHSLFEDFWKPASALPPLQRHLIT